MDRASDLIETTLVMNHAIKLQPTLRIDLGARRVHVGRLEEAPGDPGGPLNLPHPVLAALAGQGAVAVPVAGLVAPVAPVRRDDLLVP